MASKVRTTGMGWAVYDPTEDIWWTHMGPQPALTPMAVWNDRGAAEEVASLADDGRGLVVVSVDLSLDIRNVRLIDAAHRARHPDADDKPSQFKGG